MRRLISSGAAVGLWLMLPIASWAQGPTVRGTVLGADGKPAAGVVVELRTWAPSHTRRLAELGRVALPTAAASAASGAGGGFAIEAPALGSYTLLALPAGGPAIGLRFFPLLEDQEVGAVGLPATRSLEVRVRDQSGAPVAAALVVVDPQQPQVRGGDRVPPWPQRQTGRTDQQGRMGFTVARGLDHAVHVMADGFLRHAEHTGAGRLEVTLRAGPPVRLEVRDANGRPAAGAVVREGDDLVPRTVTADDGTAVVPAGPQPREVQVESADLGYASVGVPPASSVAAAGREIILPVVLEPAVVVHGKVVDTASGDPVAGALVWATRRIEDQITTTPEGRFELTTWSTSRGVLVSVAAFGYGFSGAQVSTADLASEIAIGLAPAGEVSGLVTDPQGQPVAGAEVAVAERRRGSGSHTAGVVSAADGSFRLSGLRLGSELEVRARHPDFADLWVTLPTLSAQRPHATLDLVLDPGLVAIGSVFDQDGRPVVGARARLWARPPADLLPWQLQAWRRFDTANAATGDEGRFRLTRVPAGAYDLVVESEGYAPTEVPGVRLGAPEAATTRGGPPFEIGEIVLLRGAEVVGRVVDSAGTPIAGALVAIMPTDSRFRLGLPIGDDHTVRTGENGSFRFADLAAGQLVQLQVQHEEFRLTEPITVRPPTDTELLVVLEPLMALTGRVLGSDGKPVPGAQVHVGWATSDGGGHGIGTEVEADGRFRTRGAPLGPVEVTATAPEHLPQTRSVTLDAEHPSPDLLFELEAGARLEGTVRGPDREPVARAFVRRHDETGPGYGPDLIAVTDELGRFRFDSLAPGPLELVVSHRAYLERTRRLEVSLGANEVDIELQAGLSISGVVVGSDGAPIDGAALDVQSEQTAPTWYAGRDRPRTDADGRFEVTGLGPGRYRVGVDAGERGLGTSEEIELESVPVRGVEVRLEPGLTLRGRIEGVGFDDLGHIRLEARPMVPGTMHQVQARPDFEGRFELAGLPTGRAMVHAERETDGRSLDEQVTLERGREPDELIFDFSGGDGTLDGVVLEDGRPVAGAEIVLQSTAGGDQARSISDQAGGFRFEGVAEGPSVVTASRGEAQRVEELDIDGHAQVRIDLLRTVIAGTVTDRRSGAPIAGAAVTAHQRTLGATGGRAAPTRSDGAFRLAVLPGDLTVRVARDGYVMATIEEPDVEPGLEQRLDIALEPASPLVITVRGPQGETPGRVTAIASEPGSVPGEPLGVAFGTSGRIELGTLPSGPVRIWVGAPGYAAHRLDVVVPEEPSPEPLAVVLGRGGTVRLQLPGLDSELRGSLSAYPPDDELRPFLVAPLTGGLTTIPNLPPGLQRLAVQLEDGRRLEALVTVIEGQTVEAVATPVDPTAERP